MRVRRAIMLIGLLTTWLGKRAGVAIGALLPYILALLALVLCGWLLWNNGFNRGVETTELKYQNIIAQEQRRMEQANADALAEAMKRQRAYEVLLGERNAKISELLKQAAEDPNSGRTAIGVDSVRRINSIR